MLTFNSVNRKIWLLSWPMILSNISVPLLGLVDTAILGHLDNSAYLAAVAVSSTILSFLYWGCGFLRMGTTGLTAKAFGAKDHPLIRLILAQSISLGLLLALAIIALSGHLIGFGLWLIGPPEQTRELALAYSEIRIYSAPAVLINFAIIGWFIGRQNTKPALWLALFTNLSNILFDFIFIIGLDMKSEGAALATVLAEYLGLILALRLLVRELGQLPGEFDWPQLAVLSQYKDLLSINRYIFFRTITLLICFGFFTAQGASFGNTILAANAILLNLLLITSHGLDGFAHAAEALVGETVGQQDSEQLKRVLIACGYWSLYTAIAFTLAFAVFEPVIIELYTSIIELQDSVAEYYGWLLVLPIISVWSYLFDGVFIGALKGRAMQNTMLFSALVIFLPIWYLTQAMGNHGLWLAFIAFNAARGLSQACCVLYYNYYQRWW